jgi:hypothetical protein
VRSKRGINTLRKKKLSNKTAAQRCVWRFYTVTLKNSLNRRFLSVTVSAFRQQKAADVSVSG